MSENTPAGPDARCVVFFDIDGTLLAGPVNGPSAGMSAMNLAIEELTGAVGVYDTVEFAGRTDVQIARDLLVMSGEADPARERVLEAVNLYVSLMTKKIEKTPYTVIGRPRLAVDALERKGAVVALGTGNVRAGARVKLGGSGIGDLFDMEKGGFGEDGDTRADVLRFGARSCDPSGELPVIIVGDTPHDVKAAHEIGAKCIGTPYRRNDAKILQDAGADAIVKVVDASLAIVVERLL
jgi:phosphoglycolate phosphatase